ncbi:class I SAM-dependent methyltransferase [Cognatishimia sp. SS12]|uniref:class I SAM-dependent methyltransferase n=1 Tax=Cognatishimia sp. SS12 TaxID=2979465 RepID=UPI00232AA19C|nr:class I SAM-dependent methyltransferase [Cognatishimia sp. SS12]MDC0737867.1 class I SAM-dependent methyltransferase [Cognatishimia sp. SS12]
MFAEDETFIKETDCQIIKNDAFPIERAGANPVVKTTRGTGMKKPEIDSSVFDDRDYLNIILQRSEVMHDVSKAGKLVKAWSEGDETGLLKVVSEKGSLLAERAFADISEEFEVILSSLNGWVPKSVADVGCGYGFFSLLCARAFNSNLFLIDVEENDHRHFGFSKEGAAYSSLQRAEQFLAKNGAGNVKVTSLNPLETDVCSAGDIDLAVSLLACGFHFPVDSYLEFFEENVVPGGRIILDIRQKKFESQVNTLAHLGHIEVISDAWKNRSRIMITKPS